MSNFRTSFIAVALTLAAGAAGAAPSTGSLAGWSVTGDAVSAGGVITLQVPLGAGESCQAEYGGTFWTVRNDSDTPIPSGSRARIARVQDLTLLVRPEK